eukprot:TRINITY_DN4015_c0_g1_i1.p2 TRINITY_DN4015_c0_g1~~TRINITY_DN4015_c0_g1_i1.p2  ORF type:complete len:173 (+),score=50.53 TRINITY_DN4015_c0_g1_i1:789-1307(+)
MNLVFQLRIGMMLERKYGTARVIAVYLLAGIGGNIFSCVCKPFNLGVGASGALYGLVGVYAAHVVMNWSSLPPQEKMSSGCFLGIMIFATFMLGMMPLVDIYAHIGGFVIGVLIGSYFVRPDYPQKFFYMSTGGRVAFVVVSALLVFMFVGMTVLLYTVTYQQVVAAGMLGA